VRNHDVLGGHEAETGREPDGTLSGRTVLDGDREVAVDGRGDGGRFPGAEAVRLDLGEENQLGHALDPGSFEGPTCKGVQKALNLIGIMLGDLVADVGRDEEVMVRMGREQVDSVNREKVDQYTGVEKAGGPRSWPWTRSFTTATLTAPGPLPAHQARTRSGARRALRGVRG
jgi:hypothetical protein